MAWSQLIVLLAFFVLPLLHNLLRKRAMERVERSSTREPSFDFQHSSSPPEWASHELTPQPVSAKSVYTRTKAATASTPSARRPPTPKPELSRPLTTAALPSPATIRTTLRSRQGFRRAMVHKVVLGQPRALLRGN